MEKLVSHGSCLLARRFGIDTGITANEAMAQGFPDRMKGDFKSAMEVMYENKRYGQKNSVGLQIQKWTKGKPKKVVDETT